MAQGSGQQAQGGGQQQQQESPVQRMGRALSDIRRVQSLLELNFPGQTEAIKMQREAGDMVWEEIQRLQQQAQQAQQAQQQG